MKRLFLVLGFVAATLSLSAQEKPQALVLNLEQALEIALSENPTIKIALLQRHF